MEQQKKNNKTKWLLLLLLLLFLLISAYWIITLKSPKTTSTTPNSTEITVPNNNTDKSDESAQIIKCQNVVIAPKSTTELFTYVSGRKIRADYRIGATTNEDSFKTEIFYDGEWLYVWNPALRFDPEVPVNNPPGVKMRLSSYNHNIDLSVLDTVERFGSSPLSGDRLCTVWDDVDPVFELPDDVQFIESTETTKKIEENLARICTVCGESNNDSSATCRKNLSCKR